MVLSWNEHEFVRDGIEQDMRVDGRARDDYRPMVGAVRVDPGSTPT